jgi:ferredoxin-NADP reductase
VTDRAPADAVEHPWLGATLLGTRRQSRHARTLIFRVPGWRPHLPGQHVEIRLTAPDGYTAERRYSIAEPYAHDRVAITVALRPHGEVSPYLVQTMKLGDQVDVRGPFDAGFSWDPDGPDSPVQPLLLLAGDTGIVPLVSILRGRSHAAERPRVLLVYWTLDERSLLYRADLDAPDERVEVRVIYDGSVRTGPGGTVRRIASEELREPRGWGRHPGALAYVSGPDRFADEATASLRERGYSDGRIKVQRFGSDLPR